jgi:hypothetical protein
MSTDPVYLAQRLKRMQSAFNHNSIEELQAMASEYTEEEMAIKMQILQERIYHKKLAKVARALRDGDVAEINRLIELYGQKEFTELEGLHKQLEADRKQSRLASAMSESNTTALMRLRHEYEPSEFALMLQTLENKLREKRKTKLFAILDNGDAGEIEKARKKYGDLEYNQFMINYQAKKEKNNANAAAHNKGAKAFFGRYLNVPFTSEQKVGTKVLSLEARKRATNAQIKVAFNQSNRSAHGGPALVRSPSEEIAEANSVLNVPLEVVVTKFKGRNAAGNYLYDVADFDRFKKFKHGGTRRIRKQKMRYTRK